MTPSTARPLTTTSGRLPHGPAFWVVALTFLTQMAFCALPTALYAIYQEEDGFPDLVLTAIFSVYAVGVMVSLYLAGHVSDRFGRRPVLLCSLVLNLLAAALFLLWHDVAGLLVARLVCGLGVGVLAATATAHLSELGVVGGGTAGRTALVSTFANLGGIGLGALLGGVLATWSPAPLKTPFLTFAALMVVEVVLVAVVPETVERRGPREAYRPQRIAVPPAARGTFWSAGTAAFGSFAVLGTFMGLSSILLVGVLGLHSHLLAGAAPFVVFMSAAAAQVCTERLSVPRQVAVSVALAGLGLLGVGASAVLASLTLFLVGGALAGAGVGIVFRAALGVVAVVADSARRGEAMAGVFLVAYAGMTLPPLLIAAALTTWSAVPVLVAFSAVAFALVAASGSRMLRA